MKVDYHPHITLAETRNIVISVRKLFSYDLSVLSPANLQLLLSLYINEKGIKFPDVLISRLTEYPDVFNDLLRWIDVPDSEMFRNPEVWRFLQTSILPELIKSEENPTIWFPSCSAGEELYSFVILAIEAKFREKTKILATSVSQERLNEASRGLFKGSKLEISKQNYTDSGGKVDLENYIDIIEKIIVRKKEIRKNIEFGLQGLIPEKRKDTVDLIIYKNRLIYFTPEARLVVLKNLIDSISEGGYLVLGYKENILDEELLLKVQPVHDEEKIYRII